MHSISILSENPMVFNTIRCIYGVNNVVRDFDCPVEIADGSNLSSVEFWFLQNREKISFQPGKSLIKWKFAVSGDLKLARVKSWLVSGDN